MTGYNLYIDESCHLENDGFPVICIGYIKINREHYENFKEGIKAIKLKHRNPVEIKWRNMSYSRLSLYRELVDYFFEKEMAFRCVLVKDKDTLKKIPSEAGYHDRFYYNLIFHLLNTAVNPSGHEYRIYLDIKDTRGRDKFEKINEKLAEVYEGNSPFTHFQQIHSDENVFLQLADLFIGAITFKARNEHKKPNASKSKNVFLEYLATKSACSLDESTAAEAKKFNIYQPKKI